MQRRSVRLIEHSVSNKVNDELDRIRSFIKPISVPIVETPDTGKIQGENLLRKFVAESVSFRKFGFNKVCNICVTSTPNDDGQLVKCSGTCDGYVHRKCFANRFSQRLAGRDDDRGSTQPVCDDCRKESEGFCFICKTDDDSFKSQTINCTFSDCLRRYHVSCLKNWPQTKWNGNDDQNVTFICPLHECHQCRSNDYCETNLATCIKCPTAFHTQAACTQAGTVRLSNSHIICIKHCQLRKIRTNLNYCYICKTGRSGTKAQLYAVHRPNNTLRNSLFSVRSQSSTLLHLPTFVSQSMCTVYTRFHIKMYEMFKWTASAVWGLRLGQIVYVPMVAGHHHSASLHSRKYSQRKAFITLCRCVLFRRSYRVLDQSTIGASVRRRQFRFAHANEQKIHRGCFVRQKVGGRSQMLEIEGQDL